MTRFDITEAWFLYLAGYHGGQGSEEYRRLGRMLDWFKPAASLSLRHLTHEGARVYNQLVAKHDKLTGYTPCPCRDCMETSLAGSFCHACEAAECTLESECRVGQDVYLP